ncbi:MAG: nucleotidyl transferase AbiEii/AbiGii toxin family protein [Chitinophagaceae bacterium]
MATGYLHDRKDFKTLLEVVGGEMIIEPFLIEKDYWIMHILYGLKKQGFGFELKGGTSLSKGYKIIDRFSEDIDIHITPPPELQVEENPKKNKAAHIESRKKFYDWLTKEIKIDGIVSVERDTSFDNTETYNSGGIRLFYESKTEAVAGVKEGILLEAGFDTVTPNNKVTISSWAFDKAVMTATVSINDNRAVDIPCYHKGYTFVEKLQTIATKFRQEKEDGMTRPNYMRQYYDIACLLENEEVQKFIGTYEYHAHKKIRFPKKEYEIPITKNEAFLLSDATMRETFRKRYRETKGLYYKGQRKFDELLDIIKGHIDKL